MEGVETTDQSLVSLIKEVAELKVRVEALEKQETRWQAAHKNFIATALNFPEPSTQTPTETNPTIAKLTTKQHVVLQMLLAGRGNQEIADRLGVSVNTAKVHVRGVARKYGCNTRSQVVMKAYSEFETMPQGAYVAVSGGLPKDWSNKSLDSPIEEDPYRNLYQLTQEPQNADDGETR